jgi:hypothetical protein
MVSHPQLTQAKKTRPAFTIASPDWALRFKQELMDHEEGQYSQRKSAQSVQQPERTDGTDGRADAGFEKGKTGKPLQTDPNTRRLGFIPSFSQFSLNCPTMMRMMEEVCMMEVIHP